MTIAASSAYDVNSILESGDVGVAVTYTPHDGFPVSLRIIRGARDSKGGRESRGADSFGQIDEVIIQAADIAEVRQGDTIKISATPFAEIWEVVNAELLDSRTMWRAEIHKKS